jgi:hypothetical protein
VLAPPTSFMNLHGRVLSRQLTELPTQLSWPDRRMLLSLQDFCPGCSSFPCPYCQGPTVSELISC